MYQRHEFGAPPPIFTPPPNPFNQSHHSTEVGSRKDPLKNWAQPMKDALENHQDGDFPAQLSPISYQNMGPQPVPAIDFSDNITQSVSDLFNKEMKIYVTPTDYFTTKFRKIFTKAKTKVTTSKYARKWIKGPDMVSGNSS